MCEFNSTLYGQLLNFPLQGLGDRSHELKAEVFRWFSAPATPAGFLFPKEARSTVKFLADYYPSADYKFYVDVSKIFEIRYVAATLAFVGVGVNESLTDAAKDGFWKRLFDSTRMWSIRPNKSFNSISSEK